MEETKKYNKMLDEPVSSLIVKLAIPTVISMLVTSIYNMADTYFVSKLGSSESGAVGIVFSLMAIIQAVGFTIGMGAGSWISRLLGAKDNDKAIKVCSSAFFCAITLGVFVASLGLIFVTPLMKLLGATDTILSYAVDYSRYILFAAPIMISSFVLNNILRAEGRARFSMIGLTTGGILNIILDPIFIFKLDMGISGAAVATAISQCVSFLILFSCFLRKKTITRVAVKYISREAGIYIRILQNGTPSLCRQGLASISTVMLNRSARVYGDPAIAALSIVGKIFMVIFSIMIGIGQGYQPVVGYNYGAKRLDRVKKSFFFTLKLGIVIMTSLSVIGFFVAPDMMSIFCNDKNKADVIKIGTMAFRAQCIAMPLVPLSIVCNMTFQGIGKSVWATLTSASRQGIFFIPFILILPKLFQITGIEITQALSDVCTFFFVMPFLFKFFKKLDGEQKIYTEKNIEKNN